MLLRARCGNNIDVVDFFHVHFQMVSSFEHLAASFAGVRHKSALVLVAHVAQQRALEVKNAGTHRALELGTLGRLAHGVHRVSVGQPL